jgi:hypothetical protein
MTDPAPKKKRSKKKPAKKKVKVKQPTAQEVQDEVVTADEVVEESLKRWDSKPTEKVFTNRVFSCLWQGTDLPGFSNDAYSPVYVDRLRKGVEKHVPNGQLTMVCDEFYYDKLQGDPRFKAVRLERFDGHGIGGWTNMLEVFREGLRPKMGRRHILVGLDTVFVGNSKWLFDWDKSPIGLPLDPYKAPLPCNAVTTFNFEGAAFIWDAFEVAKTDGFKDYMMFGCASEMSLLRFLYEQEKWYPLEPRAKKLLSYKVHWNQMRNPFLESPSMVYFHGRPKPHEMTPHDPVRRIWEGR